MERDDRHTLLLQLVGPLQSWGVSSQFTERDSGSEPSKSGVIGILAAALGRPRSESIDDLASLRMGVRVDREGVPGYDYQTAGAAASDPGIAVASDSAQKIARRIEQIRHGTLAPSGRGRSSVSRRHLLFDAMFLVGLEGADLTQLELLDRALRNPVFAIGLGRRSYAPSIPLALPGSGVRPHTPLVNALEQADPIRPKEVRRRKQDTQPYRLVIEATGDEPAAQRMDQPIGAAFRDRTFALRSVHFSTCPRPREENDDDDSN